MKQIITTAFSVCLLLCSSVGWSAPQREVAILDLSVVDGETNASDLESVTHILRVSGIPFIVTSSAAVAVNYSAVIATSRLENYSLSATDKVLVKNYVTAGGKFICTNVKATGMFTLFGISANVQTNSRTSFTFNTALQDPAFRWLDDPLETTISLGKSTYTTVINTYAYTLNGATPLAYFNDNTVAVTKFKTGLGNAYALGFSFKDLIVRNQLNRDYEAQRTYSNGFEPSTDAIILFIKGILIDNLPFAVWSNTSPGNSHSALLVTHDIDSKTAMDTMKLFADYEQSIGLSGMYFITVHYIWDKWDKDFYTMCHPQIDYVLQKGQRLGSHSIGHFVDFNSEVTIPMGAAGNTASTYKPYWHGTYTSGATVFGELEVSQALLNQDHHVPVTCFRPGYLSYSNRQAEVMQALDYKYSSSNSANDVLTSFPYLTKANRSFTGAMTSIYEIPMVISDIFRDVPISSTNYGQKVAIWLSVIQKNDANSAPSVLLIHPNRGYKLQAQKDLIAQLPAGVKPMNLEVFGDFWKARDNFSFTTSYNSALNELTIMIPDATPALAHAISLVVNNGQALSSIRVVDPKGTLISFSTQNWENNSKLVMLDGSQIIRTQGTSSTEADATSQLRVSPNPFEQSTVIEFESSNEEVLEVSVFDVLGKRIATLAQGPQGKGVKQITWNGTDQHGQRLSGGMYFCRLCTGSGRCIEQKILLSR